MSKLCDSRYVAFLAHVFPQCNGAGCFLRTNCQRYTEESYRGAREVIAPAFLLVRGGQACVNQIPLNEDKKEARHGGQ